MLISTSALSPVGNVKAIDLEGLGQGSRDNVMLSKSGISFVVSGLSIDHVPEQQEASLEMLALFQRHYLLLWTSHGEPGIDCNELQVSITNPGRVGEEKVCHSIHACRRRPCPSS